MGKVISNLFFHNEKKPSSPLADPNNSTPLRDSGQGGVVLNKRKSMANLEEILSAEARSARRKGVQRSESAKVSHQRQPMLQSRKQSEPQFDINQTFCDPGPAGGQGGSPEDVAPGHPLMPTTARQGGRRRARRGSAAIQAAPRRH